MHKKELWENTLSTIEVEITKASFATFLSSTELLSLDQQTATIACPNALIIERVKKQYANLIKETLHNLTGKNYNLTFEVCRRSLPSPKTTDLGPLFTQTRKTAGLFPAYTFDNFIVGSSNQLAHAAACSVAKEPGTLHNPLLFHADVGLGKTHLMHAIGNTIRNRNPKASIYYCSAEHFTNEMIIAIRNRRTAMIFKRKFRSVDLLMIDDIQFLAGRESTQEEFFNTFNELYLAGKQIVLTSDQHPQKIKDLEARLVSRFAGGTIVDIQPPDLDLRISLISQKARERGMTLNEKIIFTLARRIVGNIRQLEGSLNQLLLLAQTHRKATPEELLNLIADHQPAHLLNSVPPEKIVKRVCREFSMAESEITTSRRTKESVLLRQVTMYLLRENSSLSLNRIGKLLGGRDHSTILHGLKAIEGKLKKDPQLQSKIKAIRASL